jgi:hypothetical protein
MQVTLAKKVVIFTIFFLAGVFNVIFTNILYNTQGAGSHNRVSYFRKPIFQTWGMFLGMALAIFNTPTIRRCHCAAYSPTRKLTGWGLLRVVSLPAMCDLMASTLLNTALLYILPSSWQMLRSSAIVFIGFLSIFHRHKRLLSIDWIGIISTILGIAGVAIAAVLEQTKILSYSTREVSLGIALVVLSQIIQGVQAVLEDELVHEIDAPPTEVCAFEGIWGLWVSTLVLLPLANIVPESLGEGLFESSLESFKMTVSSLTIGLLVLGYFVVASAYNQAGIMVTAMSSASQRIVWESLRSIVIWVVAVAVHAIWPHSGAGERLSGYSGIKVGGFLLILVGVLVYNRVLRIPGLKVEDAEVGLKEELIEPDNISSALSWRGPPVD